MGSGKRWVYLITGPAVAFVGISVIVQAVTRGSWSPIIETSWLPAVMVAVWPGATCRRCLPGRRQAR